MHRTVQYLSLPLTYKGGREADFGLPHLYLDGGVVHSSWLKAGIVPLGRSVSDEYLIWLLLLLLLLASDDDNCCYSQHINYRLRKLPETFDVNCKPA